MLFDVQAVLAEILGDAPERCDCCDSRDSTGPESRESRESQSQPVGIQTPAPAPGAVVHLSRYRPMPDRNGRPVRALPTHPATCAICGRTDWMVSMSDMRGRTLHVECWTAEGGHA